MKDSCFHMYPCLYTATVYEGFDQEKKESIYGEDTAIIFAESYSHAMHQIEEYYADNLVNIKLELFMEGPVLIPRQNIALIKEILDGEVDYE